MMSGSFLRAVCLSLMLAPSVVSLGDTAFSVKSGGCTADSSCIMSPNFPNNYDNDCDCSVDIKTEGTLHVEHFDTESSYDELTVGGKSYSGSSGPDDVDVFRGSRLHFHSDGSNTRSGFKVCLIPPPEDEHVLPVAPDNTSSVELFCTHGCDHVRMVGSRAGYVVSHVTTTAGSHRERAALVINGACQINVWRMSGAQLHVDGTEIDEIGTQMLGEGRHTIHWQNSGSSADYGWAMMIVPVTGGCADLSRGFQRGCNASAGPSKFWSSNDLQDATRCLDACRSRSTNDGVSTCCFFGFADTQFGCYAYDGGTVQEPGHAIGRSAACTPQSPVISGSTVLLEATFAESMTHKKYEVAHGPTAAATLGFGTAFAAVSALTLTAAACVTRRSGLPDFDGRRPLIGT